LSESFTLDLHFSFDFSADPPVAALFGPSGCGKSTTLSLIAGLMAPDTGTITLDGVPLADASKRMSVRSEHRGVGLVAQDGLLFPHLTVEGNLAYAERRRRGRPHAPRAEIDDALSLSPLLARRRPFAQRRRTPTRGAGAGVAVGAAAAPARRAGLGSRRGRALEALALIERVTRRFAVPALFVSHQRTEVARVAREAARMADGRIVAQGDAVTVLAHAPEAGSIPNVFRVVYLAADRARIPGGATIQLPRVGSPGEQVWCRLASGAIALAALSEPGLSSARNHLTARVVTVEESMGRVRVAVDAGVVLHADVTPESARRLALRPGASIACVFKVHSMEMLA
jgi:molybdate transport system ATP-binding protein